jgi:hypothetical protein
MILSLIVCNEADYTNNSRLMQLPGFALFPIVFAFSGDRAGPPYRNLKRQVGATFPTIPGIALCYWILHVIARFDRSDDLYNRGKSGSRTNTTTPIRFWQKRGLVELLKFVSSESGSNFQSYNVN